MSWAAIEAIGDYVNSVEMCDELVASMGTSLACARALARAGDPRSIPVLISALSGDVKNATHAAECLAIILTTHAAPDAFDPLMAAVRGDDFHLRLKAVRALGALGDERARETLLTILSDIEPGESETDPRFDMDLEGEVRSALRKLGWRNE
jgi:HEAT repeat protein